MKISEQTPETLDGLDETTQECQEFEFVKNKKMEINGCMEV